MRHALPLFLLLAALPFLSGCAQPAPPDAASAADAPVRTTAPVVARPAPQAQEPMAEPSPSPAPDGVAHLGDDTIRYTARGWDAGRRTDRAIVLVHGWASDRSAWSDQIEPLARHAPVIAIDLPGHGDSDLPESTLTMDLFAEAIAAVLDDAGVATGALVGHSNGTPAIRQFYRAYPERTDALIIVDGALKRMIDDATAARIHDTLSAPGHADFVTAMIAGMASTSPSPGALEGRLLPAALATPQRTLVESFDAGADASIWFDDPITVPTLVVLADAPFWDEAYERHVRELVRPSLEYRKLPGVSHFVQIDAPETFNALVLAFLRSIDFIDS